VLGYSWVLLHAALNDLPTALLLAAILFDLLGAVNRRDSLRAAGYWCLVAGVIGGVLAALAGLMAETVAPHDDAGHALMETHETFAFVVLAIFFVLLLWRTLRRLIGRQEQTIFTTAGVIGIGLLAFTARLGGSLVFEHAVGIDNHVLQDAIEGRREGHHHEEGEEHEHATPAPAQPDSLRADTAHAHP
jgi:uncharacterized membrane protein